MAIATYDYLGQLELTSNASSISITGISQSYENLVFDFMPITNGDTEVLLTFNNVTGVYDRNLMRQYVNGTIGASGGVSQTQLDISEAVRVGTSPSALWTAKIPGYSGTTFTKNIIMTGTETVGGTTNGGVDIVMGHYNATSAISSIQFYTAGGVQFVAGTVIRLWGLD